MNEGREKTGFSGLSCLTSDVDEAVAEQASRKNQAEKPADAPGQGKPQSSLQAEELTSGRTPPPQSTRRSQTASGASRPPTSSSSGAIWFWSLVGVGVFIWLAIASEDDGTELAELTGKGTTYAPAPAGITPEQTSARAQVLQAHPDFDELVHEPGFIDWLNESPWRMNVAQSWDATATIELMNQYIAHRETEGDHALTALVQAGCADWNTSTFFEDATVMEVRRCLSAGADLDARNALGWTPLHLAARYSDSAPVVTTLLDTGADLEARTEGGFTPLHAAGSSDNPSVVAALLKAGANLEARAEGGLTPLHSATGSGDSAPVVAVLLEAGADLEARTEGGWTPLHMATSVGVSPSVVTMLLDAGADKTAENNGGATPWDLIEGDSALHGTDVYWRLLDIVASEEHPWQVSVSPGGNTSQSRSVAPIQIQPWNAYFTKNSHENDVLRLQGTPSQILRYDTLGGKIWYFDSSTVEIDIRTKQVRRWNNYGNLKVK